MARHDRKGRSKGGGQYFGLSYSMAKSPAFRSLPGPALKTFIELRCRYNGNNNGDLSLSYGEAAKLLSIGKTTAKRAFDELVVKGFIVRTSEGYWYGRRAATWAVTDKTIDCPKFGAATNAWKRWGLPSLKSISRS